MSSDESGRPYVQFLATLAGHGGAGQAKWLNLGKDDAKLVLEVPRSERKKLFGLAEPEFSEQVLIVTIIPDSSGITGEVE